MFPPQLFFGPLMGLFPFLLVHYVSAGLELEVSAILVQLPFAQRWLVLMCGRGR